MGAIIGIHQLHEIACDKGRTVGVSVMAVGCRDTFVEQRHHFAEHSGEVKTSGLLAIDMWFLLNQVDQQFLV